MCFVGVCIIEVVLCVWRCPFNQGSVLCIVGVRLIEVVLCVL